MLCGVGSSTSGAKVIFSVSLSKSTIGFSCSFNLKDMTMAILIFLHNLGNST